MDKAQLREEISHLQYTIRVYANCEDHAKIVTIAQEMLQRRLELLEQLEKE